MKVFRHLLIYIGLFAGAIILFSRLGAFQEDSVKKFTSEQEQKLSNVLRDVMVTERTLVQDEHILEFVEIIKDRLLSTIESPKYDYQVYIVRNRTVNAFALPGGVLVLHTGLLAFADSPEEVVAVLAHEIGHSEEGHIMNKLMKEVGFGVLFGAITGGDVGVMTEIGRKLLSSSFDRGYEREADAYAMQLMENASINPRYLAVFFHRMAEDSDNIMNRIDFISTHPSHESRRQAALEYQTSDDFEELPLEGFNWELVKGLSDR